MLRILRATAYVHYTTSLTLSLSFFRNTPITPNLPPQALSQQYRNYTTTNSVSVIGRDTGVIMSDVAMMSSDDDKEGSKSEVTNSTNHYDYLVIGGGSGGVSSARRAASYGAKVAIVEPSLALGGTCVNVGCVPKKIMFNTAWVNEVFHGAEHFGFNVENYSFDWGKIKELRDNYVTKLNKIYLRNLQNSGVTVLLGHAAFTGENSVVVDNKEYTASNILIATGGLPAMPDIPGAELAIDSNGFFELEKQPVRVAVLGAGYIAVELAGVFHALGTHTSLYCRGNMALRRFDSIVKETLDSEMKKAGMHVYPGSVPQKISQDKDSGLLNLHLENGSTYKGFDVILSAIGRKPATKVLNLTAANVICLPSGHIAVDSYQRTSVKGIYALGDVCGKVELTPMAIAAGRRLADRLFGNMPKAKANYDMVPTVIFSHPTIGTVGLTEEEAEAKYGAENLTIYTSSWVNLYFGHWPLLPEDKQVSKAKLICEGENEKVVGLHIIGMGADEMLQGFGVALQMGATKSDFDKCVAIHPTASEELVTLAPWGLKKNEPKKDTSK